ncbi:SDR family oxidoreductase [Paenibacillus donghaensis]|uniref:NAD(P)-dependent oxidoreductase n=1 Tax=Paenibacillus donghaensis TaxID=414771 RepID=A0A2Z2KR35_9BACL|nr:SDR family oxidoreductase [Paenibacillus donghaensis]ASA21408.1 NAD(P)-dependent oxidoreductase [Paenibacillus donghaensis]
MTLLITGAAGQLGSLIIQTLDGKVPAGQVIAGVRNLDQATLALDKGMQVRLTDYDRPDTLASAFEGVEQVLLISSSHTDDELRLQQHNRVIAAAKTAGVKHLLYTSFAFPPKGPIPTNHVHMLTEQAILASGLEYTMLRNALYIDFVGVLGMDEAIRSGELRTPPGAWRFNSVTRKDLAGGIAAVLSSAGHRNQIYELTAPAAWTFTDLATSLSELAGKPVVHREDPNIQHWIYPFMSKLDTSSTSDRLVQLLEGPVTGLTESIRPLLQGSEFL